MVLDAKALTWAAQHNIDTAKLKAAKVPIYGKWYFPEIPADVPLVNLETGEQQVFAERMVAGELIFVPAEDLKRAGLAPEAFVIMDRPPTATTTTDLAGRGLRVLAPEPLLAMARPPGYASHTGLEPSDIQEPVVPQDEAALAGIHLPSASIAPLVLGAGFCILMFGVISHWIIIVVGLLWMLAGVVGWIRIGLIESRAAEAHAAGAAEGHPAA